MQCLWIVRPQHCNSKNILFGGTLMRWVEEVSSIAARRICPTASWSSAAIDSLTFKFAVEPGMAAYCRAGVVKVWDSSIEVAVTVTCGEHHLLCLSLAYVHGLKLKFRLLESLLNRGSQFFKSHNPTRLRFSLYSRRSRPYYWSSTQRCSTTNQDTRRTCLRDRCWCGQEERG